MGGRLLLRPLGVALVAPLVACLQSPPDRADPSCQDGTAIAEIALGRDHACARLENGGVWCWGLNDQGQLGDGTQFDRSRPSQVTGLRDVIRLAAGQDHTCALRSDHSLWCWGSGSNGQLGDGRADDAFEPVQVEIEDVVDMSMGDDFSCAVTGGGEVDCWGENEHGQAGPDFDEVVTAPTRIDIDGEAVGVATGENHACALLEDRTVACWGAADLGQLGDGTQAERGAGAPVMGLAGATAVVSGRNHACAITEAGALLCWGSNERGQLGQAGDNSLDECESGTGIAMSCLPVEVELGDDVRAAAGGLHHTCATTSEGEVYCFGGNGSGELGNGGFDDSAEPVKVQIQDAVARVAAGETQNCATTEGGQVFCWGSNRAGQLAEIGALVSTVPARVAAADGALSVAAGAHHTCARVAGGLLCWGANDSSQLGDGTVQARSTPTPVVAVSGSVPAVSPGEEHTCVLNGSERVRCWGRNAHAELGPTADEDVELAAVTVDVGDDVIAVDSGDEHVCAVRVDGLLYCWGSDSEGQLGNGAPESTGPVEVATLADVVGAACGDEHTCALTGGGEVFCWGDNDSGQLGDNSTGPRTQPGVSGIALGGLVASQIAAGDEFSCALAEGQVLCWGENEFGQLGNGSNEVSLVPTPVALNDPATAISVGTEHACAIVADGDVRLLACWGRNDGGQLGDGSTDSSTSPVVVPLDGEPLEVAAGDRHTCALVNGPAGTEVHCWGSDVDGQLGSGRDLYYQTAIGPISVCQ